MAYIRVHDLAVDFPLYQGGSRSLKKALVATSSHGNLARDAFDRITVHALKGVTLEIAEGDRIAVLGANGAGKTTLLKVLTGIYHPTHGSVHIDGRISAMLDIAAGFNTDATGRENVLLRGMYMDIHPRVMLTHVDEIAEFSELGQYFEMPVRTYSSGMMVRLAFAISTCITPEILVMDEWLSAGDAHFLAKAQRRMSDFVNRSSILVLASHSMPLLREWCNRGIYLRQGGIVVAGSVEEAIKAYEAA